MGVDLRPRPTLRIPNVSPVTRIFANELRRLAWKQLEASFTPPEAIWEALLKVAVAEDIDIEGAQITAEQFRRVCDELRLDLSNPLVLNPETFQVFSSGRGSVGLVQLFGYIAKKTLVAKLRCSLEVNCCDPFTNSEREKVIDVIGSSRHQLNRDDVEAFIAEQLPHLRVARDCLPWMIPYYMAHCSAKLMFAVDVHRARTVDVDALIASEPFNELLVLHEHTAQDAITSYPVGVSVEIPEALVLNNGAPIDLDGNFVVGTVVDFEGDGSTSDCLYQIAVGPEQNIITVPRESLYVSASAEAFPAAQRYYDCMAGFHGDRPANWFCITNCISVYLHFCNLDRDSDGMLSRDELKRYNNGCFSDIVIDRIFDVHVQGNHNKLMDYKGFLDFVVATEFPGLRASVKYFWKILDIAETHEYIHVDVLRQFCGQISRKLGDAQLMTITGDSVLSELIDMINPKDVDRVTLEDIEKCGQAATVLPVMLDFRCFFNYDSREQAIQNGTSCTSDS